MSAAVVVALAVVDSAAAERREAQRLVALTDVPGVATSLEEPLHERWRVDGSLVGDLGDTVHVGDPGTGITRAVDATTGAVRWTRRAPDLATDETCHPEPPDAAGAVVAVCVASVAPEGAGVQTVTAVVSEVDAATGRTTALHHLERTVLDVARVEGDLVIVTAETAERVGVRRWDTEVDEIRWRLTTADPVFRGGRLSTDWSARVLSLRGSRSLAVDLRTGRELPPEYVNDLRALDVLSHALPAGRTVEWPNAGDGEAVPGVARVKGPGGEILQRVDGRPWFARVDDGSAADLLVVRAHDRPGTRRAVDLQSGDPAWSRPVAAAARPVLLVAGVLVVVDGSDDSAEVVALDARTGRVRWTWYAVPGVEPVTDGRDVLLAHGSDGVITLTAHRLDDGTPRWTVRLPAGAREVVTLSGGGVVAVGPGWVAGLG